MKPNAPANMSGLQPGLELVPGYVLQKLLGRGGFGEVWQAKAPGGFEVALKCVSLQVHDGKHSGVTELRSLDIIKGIHHPNLLGIFGAWHIGEVLVIAMELAERSLWDRFSEVRDQGLRGIDREELLEYFEEAAKGIDHLNAYKHNIDGKEAVGVQHRDIKPQNILLIGGSVKVADFGLARLVQNSITRHTGSLTVAYAPPEFFKGKTARHSDQYSFAVTYCHMRGGALPFNGIPAQIMAGHIMEPPDLSMLPAEEHPAVQRALAKDPEERWPNCREFVRRVRLGGTVPTIDASGAASTARVRISQVPTLAEDGSLFTPADHLASPPRGPRSGRRRLVAGLLLGVLLLAGPAWWLGFRLNSGATSHAAGAPSKPSGGTKEPDPSNTVPNLPPPREKEFTNSIDMQLVAILAGKFQMGSPSNEDTRSEDETAHLVRITRHFYLGKHTVTQEEYQKVMGKNPSWFSAEGGGREAVKDLDTRRFPVENVSWDDAVEFCRQLSALAPEKAAGRVYRLPTEAEWEYACRSGTTTPFHFGVFLSSSRANFDGNYPYGHADKGPFLERTTRVGSFPPNAFQLHDMHGNVWQWCADYYDKDYYTKGPGMDPRNDDRGPMGLRLLRGGAWDVGGRLCRAAYRHRNAPNSHLNRVGFRVACTILAPPS